MNFGNLEKIEEMILRPAKNFSIKNTVILGRRNTKTGCRMDCFKETSYVSKKYADHKYVGNLYMESSDFLVFTCKSDETNNIIEIYSSYQHIQKIRNAFKEMVDNIDKAFFQDPNTGVITLKTEYESFVVSIDNLVGNHSIKLVFDVMYDDNAVSNQYTRGITLFFNDENAYTTVTDENLMGITYFLENFNLLSSSQHLKQLAYMQQLAYSLELTNIEMEPVEYATSTGGNISNRPLRKIKKSSLLEED